MKLGTILPLQGCCSCLHSPPDTAVTNAQQLSAWTPSSLSPTQKLIPDGEQSQHWFIHTPVYLSGEGLELPQVGKLRHGCAYQEGVCMCLLTHTYARGWTQSAEGCAFVYLQQATASWSHKDFHSLAPLRASHIKLCLAAAFSDKAGL